MPRIMKGKDGFTLIEMFIVIAIIGILAGIVLRGTAGFQQSARDTRRIGDLKNVQTYLELYFNKCGHYPGDANCGNTPPTNWNGVVNALASVTSSPGNIPKDPVASRSYFYGVEPIDLLQYVLGARPEKDNKVLIDDIDGTVFGIDCGPVTGDTIYCIQS